MNICYFQFEKAMPVWAKNREREKNLTLLFSTVVNAKEGELVLAGNSVYQVVINDEFVTFGPARASHGFYKNERVKFASDRNETKIEIRVVGYNVNSYGYIDTPAFLQAEVIVDGKVVAYTAENEGGFTAKEYAIKEQRVPRYSFQRPFVEVYNACNEQTPVELSKVEDKKILVRDVPSFDFSPVFPVSLIKEGKVTYSEKEKYFTNRANDDTLLDNFKCYRRDEIVYAPQIEYGKVDFGKGEDTKKNPTEFTLERDSYIDIDMGKNATGLICADIEFSGKGTLFIAFDEVYNDDRVNPFRYSCLNVVTVLGEGKFRLITSDVYVARYYRMVAKGASVKVTGFKVIDCGFPLERVKAKCVGTEKEQKVFDAGVETFRANSSDFFMDCPSRERAGWLCDSFFTGRAERTLTGESIIERSFIMNFLYPEKFDYIDDGVLPMCYPSDNPNHNFIPNWAMWFVLELEEYLQRTNDYELIANAKDRVYGVLNYLKSFENEYGLLENLRAWVFIEWSKANEFVQDVNYPSNMLYYAFRNAISRLYGDEQLTKENEKLKKTIVEQSMTPSGFFCDNAVRKDGKLVATGNRTETCQYYAFFTGVASPTENPWLFKTMVNDFGSARGDKYAEIYPANAFIGNYLRLDILVKNGCFDKVREDIVGFFLPMAEKTGTLWENMSDGASCNHGFASCVTYFMEQIGLIK